MRLGAGLRSLGTLVRLDFFVFLSVLCIAYCFCVGLLLPRFMMNKDYYY